MNAQSVLIKPFVNSAFCTTYLCDAAFPKLIIKNIENVLPS